MANTPDASTILSKGEKLNKTVRSSDCKWQLYKYDGTVYKVQPQAGWAHLVSEDTLDAYDLESEEAVA